MSRIALLIAERMGETLLLSFLRTLTVPLLGAPLMLLTGCGVTGGTTRLVVPMDVPAGYGTIRRLSVGSVSRDDEGVRLTNVGVFAWGKFSDEDQAIFQSSLSDTLLKAQMDTRNSGDPIHVHILIRKYFVGSSNNAAAVFAGIDWALVGPRNQVLFQESFYASNECHFPSICTLGGLKDATNTAIIKRVAYKAVALAADRPPESGDIDGTYSTFEKAAKTMPAMLQSSGSMIMVGYAPIFLPSSGPQRVDIGWAEMKTPVDWKQRLSATSR